MKWPLKLFPIILAILLIILVSRAFSYRIARAPTLSLPLNQDHINQLNRFNDSIFHLQQGEFNIDVVTSTKTNAGNGDFWIIMTGATATFQFKANNQIFSVTAH